MVKVRRKYGGRDCGADCT